MTNIAIRIQLWLASLRDERGQDLLEYVLLGGGIALAITIGFLLFDDKVTAMVNNIGNCIDFTNTTPCSPGW